MKATIFLLVVLAEQALSNPVVITNLDANLQRRCTPGQYNNAGCVCDGVSIWAISNGRFLPLSSVLIRVATLDW